MWVQKGWCESEASRIVHLRIVHRRRASCIVHRASCIVHRTLCIVHSASCMVHGAWCMVHGAWCMVHGAWCIMHGAWCVVHLHSASCMSMLHVHVHAPFCLAFGLPPNARVRASGGREDAVEREAHADT